MGTAALSAAERLGEHRLHEVVNQQQEQAAEENQAHHGQEDEAADEEGVHNLQEKRNTHVAGWREHNDALEMRIVPDRPSRKSFGVLLDLSPRFP